MAADIVNGLDADITNYGAGAADPVKRTITNSGADTDAQVMAGLNANPGTALLKPSETAANKALIAGVLLDNIITDVDLSTPAKRKTFRLKKGLSELHQILSQIGA